MCDRRKWKHFIDVFYITLSQTKSTEHAMQYCHWRGHTIFKYTTLQTVFSMFCYIINGLCFVLFFLFIFYSLFLLSKGFFPTSENGLSIFSWEAILMVWWHASVHCLKVKKPCLHDHGCGFTI